MPGGIWALGGDLPEPREVAREIDWANGIGFSPDGGHALCERLRALPCAGVGRRTTTAASPGRRVFAEAPAGSCDGLAMDSEGGVLVALGEGGIARFRPDGTLDGRIEVPADFVTSLCFGGEDMRELYITGVANGGGVLLRGRADVPGLPVAPAQLPPA